MIPVRSQWGRYNLPRNYVTNYICLLIQHSIHIWYTKQHSPHFTGHAGLVDARLQPDETSGKIYEIWGFAQAEWHVDFRKNYSKTTYIYIYIYLIGKSMVSCRFSLAPIHCLLKQMVISTGKKNYVRRKQNGDADWKNMEMSWHL